MECITELIASEVVPVTSKELLNAASSLGTMLNENAVPYLLVRLEPS